jgi:hypothetical protein
VRAAHDCREIASGRVSAAREHMGMDEGEFADALGEILEWFPTPQAVKGWERRATPPGDVLVACEILTGTLKLDD